MVYNYLERWKLMGHMFSLVLSREITDHESAILKEAGCAGAVLVTNLHPTKADVNVTKMDFDDTTSPSLAEAIEAALEAVKVIPDLTVPSLTVPAQPTKSAGDESSAGQESEVVASESSTAKATAEKSASRKSAPRKKPVKKTDVPAPDSTLDPMETEVASD
jgi:hypothetical protein